MMTVQTTTTGPVQLVLCAVREIEEVRHSNEGVVERFDRGDPLVCVNGQHLG